MTAERITGLTLDTGALLALDHPARAIAMQARLDEAVRRGGTVCVPVGAIAQAWRSSRQARLARLLKSPDIDIAVMTVSVARSVGLMCADTDHDDVVDVHVVLCARQRHHAIVTS
ncbi:MAG: PIN domain-containing protein, partial [Gemmatimonadales bacterium]